MHLTLLNRSHTTPPSLPCCQSPVNCSLWKVLRQVPALLQAPGQSHCGHSWPPAFVLGNTEQAINHLTTILSDSHPGAPVRGGSQSSWLISSESYTSHHQAWINALRTNERKKKKTRMHQIQTQSLERHNLGLPSLGPIRKRRLYPSPSPNNKNWFLTKANLSFQIINFAE